MAFNFIGTFSSGQYVELEKFLTVQKSDIQKRINYLKAEMDRIGYLTVTFNVDTGLIDKIEATPSNSYVAKLFAAYQLTGGFPLKDLPIRTFYEPIGITPGSAKGTKKEYNNRRLARSPYRTDSYIGTIIAALKAWALGAIRFKREDLEYRMKRMIDWSDQCLLEILMLEKVGSVKRDFTPKVNPNFSDWALEKANTIVSSLETAAENEPGKKQVILGPIETMIALAKSEVYSGDHPSVTNDDSDVLGLRAGQVRQTFNPDATSKDVEDDIPEFKGP